MNLSKTRASLEQTLEVKKGLFQKFHQVLTEMSEWHYKKRYQYIETYSWLESQCEMLADDICEIKKELKEIEQEIRR